MLPLLSGLMIACQDLSTVEQEFEDLEVPMFLDDGLPVSSLADQDIDPQQIARLDWEIRHGEFDEIHSLVIIRNGYLVYEAYFEEGHDVNYAHRLASVTKSVISLIVGTAVHQGLITGHNQPLHELFPDEADIFEGDSRKRNLLLRSNNKCFVHYISMQNHNS